MLHALRLRRRDRAVRAAITDVALDDPRWDAETIRAAALREVRSVVEGETLRTEELARRFGGGAGHAVTFAGELPEIRARLRVRLHRPRAWFVHLERHREAGDHRVTVCVQAELVGTVNDPRTPRWLAGLTPYTRREVVRAFWTYRLDGPVWALERVEPARSGRWHLRRDPDRELDAHLHSEAVVDLAWDDETLAEEIPYDLAHALPADAGAALRELSGVDGRFAPHVVRTCVEEIVRLWCAAGEAQDPAPLAPAATDRAAAQLLDRPGWVMRGARVEEVEALRLRAMRVPPELTVRIEMRAWHGPRRAEEMRISAEVDDRPRTHWWRLALEGDPPYPWRLIEARVSPFEP